MVENKVVSLQLIKNEGDLEIKHDASLPEADDLAYMLDGKKMLGCMVATMNEDGRVQFYTDGLDVIGSVAMVTMLHRAVMDALIDIENVDD